MQSYSRAVTRMAVEHMLLQETGTYNPMHQRPYATHIDGTSLANIVDRVKGFGSAKISGSLIAGVASNIVAPSPAAGDIIHIPNGWQERRIRFMLKVHCEFNFGSTMIYYIQGYTNFPGVSNTGNVDPNMVFMINSIMGVTRVNKMTPVGMQMSEMIVESSQVLQDYDWQSPQHGQHRYVMRPQDIYVGMQTNYMKHGYGVVDQGGIVDSRAMLRNEPIKSSRANNMPANYIASVIDGYSMGAAMQNFGQSEHDVISAAIQQKSESRMNENPFIRALSEIRGMGVVGSFTFSDLERVDPNVKNVTDYISVGPTQRVDMHTVGSTSYWHGSDRGTLVASVLAQATPALMMELMISKVSLRSTNHDMGGMMNTVLTNAMAMTNADMTRQFEIFKSRFEREVLYDITFGNQEPYMLDMTVDMFGETWINVALGSDPMVPYVTPSFCDHLYAPVIASNRNQFEHVVSDFDSLVNQVTDAVNQPGVTGAYNSLV